MAKLDNKNINSKIHYFYHFFKDKGKPLIVTVDLTLDNPTVKANRKLSAGEYKNFRGDYLKFRAHISNTILDLCSNSQLNNLAKVMLFQ